MSLIKTISFVEAKEKYMNYMESYKNRSSGTLIVYSNILEEFHQFTKFQKNTFEVQIIEITIEDIPQLVLALRNA